MSGSNNNSVQDSNNISTSSPSSCMSSIDSPDDGKVMLLGVCQHCNIYCMQAREEYPICLKCKGPFLVHIQTAIDNMNRNKQQ